MKRIILATLLCGWMSSTAMADVPVDSNVESGGYQSFPVLQCPKTNEALKSMRTRLLDLKKSIKKEAANCEGITADVNGLSDLVTKDRESIMKLIEKGQAGGLTAAEQGKVEAYVQKLTEMTSNVFAVLSGNDACFDDEKQGLSLAFITSLISEGAKILSVVGGPEAGPTIQIAGEVVTGFLKAMDTIAKSRQGYNMANVDQRMAYGESLCSLFEYRRELEQLLNPYDSADRLQQLQSVLNRQISLLRSNCFECREIITMVELETKKARDNSETGVATIDQVWSRSFEQAVSTKAKQIDKLYTNRLGTHTYRSLKTLSWIPLRLESLQNNTLRADLGMRDVVKQVAIVEKFMVTEQGPKFMNELIKDARTANKTVEMHFTGGNYAVKLLKRTYPNLVLPEVKYWGTTYPQYYGQILEALDVARQSEALPKSERAALQTYFSDLKVLARDLSIAFDLVNNYCEFFEQAQWYRSNKIRYSDDYLAPSMYGIAEHCGSKGVEELRSNTQMFTNYKALMPSDEKGLEAGFAADQALPVTAAPVEVTQDWVESLTRMVEDMTKTNDYVSRTGTPNQF